MRHVAGFERWQLCSFSVGVDPGKKQPLSSCCFSLARKPESPTPPFKNTHPFFAVFFFFVSAKFEVLAMGIAKKARCFINFVRKVMRNNMKYQSSANATDARLIERLYGGPAIGPENKFRVGAELAKGTFGRVCVAFNSHTKETVAIKFIKRGRHLDDEHVRREILNHRTLRHPHIITFKEVFLTDQSLCIVMEFAEGGDMHSYLAKRSCLSETVARWFFQQLIIGVEYCHKRGVVMRDIKLENLLLDGKQRILKICDFGFSKHDLFDSMPQTVVGTRCYLAPEVLLGRHLQGQKTYSGKKVDIWTCGVCLFAMLYGRNPYEDSMEGNVDGDSDQHMLRLMRGNITIPEFQVKKGQVIDISGDCRDLLHRILLPDPRQRIDIQGIMSHPWFQDSLPAGATKCNEGVEKIDEGAVIHALGLQTAPEVEELIIAARTNPEAIS
ncbi:hypothetical protein BSKO_05892 [Bryopsis sp. KO-2023]|nr:hypothetical protein BSKO_05892 [Bryopsis sp. KO-2023]